MDISHCTLSAVFNECACVNAQTKTENDLVLQTWYFTVFRVLVVHFAVVSGFIFNVVITDESYCFHNT